MPSQFHRSGHPLLDAGGRFGGDVPGAEDLGQRLGGQGPGRVGRHRHEPLCQRGQQVQHLVHILVGHDAEEEDEFLPREAVPQALHRGPHPVGIVAAVQHKGRRTAQQLKAARPLHRLQPLADGLFRDVPSPAPQHPQGGDGHCRVPGLVAADEGQAHAVQTVEIKGHLVEVAAIEAQFGEIHHRQRGVLLLCHAGDHGIGLGHAAVAHRRAAGLEDARLGGGNVGDGGAQLFHMVHPQRRDDRALRRVDDVGGVQRAAQAHLQHHDVAFLFGKPEHPQRRDDLKLGGDIRHGVGGGAHPLHQLHQSLVGDLLAVDLDALIEAIDEGRGEQAHPVPCRLQAGGQHGCRAALAVGARHMDEPQRFVGVAQGGQQGAGAAQARLVACPLHRMNVFQRFFVVHCTISRRDLFWSSSRTSTVFTALRMRALGMRAASTGQA